MTYSALQVGTVVIPNPVERYDPEKFILVDRKQVEAVFHPSQLDSQFITHESVKEHIAHSGSYHLSPFSFNWNQHSQIYSIIGIFKKYSDHVVLSSCRVDAIARDPGLVELINYFGATNLTCAVEGISSRVCNFLQKSLMDEELYVGMDKIIQQNFASVKMYYIFTGLEGDEDLEEFEQHLQKIDELRRLHGKPSFEMRFSFTPLLSTLGTPLQYHGSKVQRSLKGGSNALFRIKHLCTRYGFGIRLSTSIASSDFSQTCEMLDRRGQGVLEYCSLVGTYNQPRLSIQFYTGEVEVTKKEYDRLAGSARAMIDGKYFKVEASDRITINKLYAFINGDTLYPDFSIEQLQSMLMAHEGKEVPEAILNAFPPKRRANLAGKKIRLGTQEGDHYYCAYPVTDPKTGEAKKQHHMLINVMVDDISIDKIKDMIPVFTNGVTFNDLIEDKDALYVFPSSHIKFHKNRHIGQDFKQYVANRAYIFDSYCFGDALARCVNCGACDNIAEVQAITKTAETKETGEQDMWRITSVKRDGEPFQKLLIEVRVEPGKFAAMETKWFRYAVTRAILRSSNKELVEANIATRFVHSRQGYRLKSDTFKSILGGSLLIEMSFNRLADMDEAYVERLRQEVNKYTTPGWSIANIALKGGDFILRNNLQYAMMTYRFDSRKVNLDSFYSKKDHTKSFLHYLEKRIENFQDANSTIKYKSQHMAGRFATRTEIKDFDKSKVLGMAASIGSNQYETVLRIIVRVEDAHPLIFLAGFLGGDSGPKGYTALYGVDVSIDGFYKATAAGANLFDAFAADDGHHDHSTECPACGGTKLINIVNGLPFGGADYERDPLLLRKHAGVPVCQHCWAEDAA